MEVHLVSLVSQAVLPACPKEGCVVVTAVLFELSDDLTSGSDWLEPLFAAMPVNEGVSQRGSSSFTGPHVVGVLRRLV